MGDYPYSIKDLAKAAGKTEQALHKFLKKRPEFTNAHTLRTGRFRSYDQDMMDAVLDYYNPANERLTDDTTDGEDDLKQSSSGHAEQLADLEEEIQNLRTELEGKKNEIEKLLSDAAQKEKECNDLKNKLETSEAERKEMIRQNGSLLLLLQEEKQEKMLLLPGPKKTFRQKLRNLFGVSSPEPSVNEGKGSN